MATGFQQSFQNVKRTVVFLNVQGNGGARNPCTQSMVMGLAPSLLAATGGAVERGCNGTCPVSVGPPATLLQGRDIKAQLYSCRALGTACIASSFCEKEYLLAWM